MFDSPFVLMFRPGYTTVQAIIGDALTMERRRLEKWVDETLDETARKEIQKLLVRENTLSELAAIKQDAKHCSATPGSVISNSATIW